MKKLTTKIICDMLMVKLRSYNTKIHNLNEKFKKQSEFLIAANDLIIKFPNLQLSEDYKTLWTPEINHLTSGVNIKSFYYMNHDPIDAYPYAIIDEHVIMAAENHTDDTWGFTIAYRDRTNSDNITEFKLWKENMRKNKIPENIIGETERQLQELHRGEKYYKCAKKK